MPAARFIIIAALLTIPLAVATVVPWLGWAAITADGLLVFAFMFDLRQAIHVPLTATRKWPPLLIQGAPATVEVVLATSSSQALHIVMREALHPAIATAPLRQVADLSGGGTSIWSYALVPRRRGQHMIGPLTVRLLGPWRLAWAQRDAITAEPHRIYPQVRWEGQVGRLLTLAHRREMGAVPMRHHGVGFEPYALREYRSGDSPNKIHWRASARHGKLVAREDTWERGVRLVILLDAARAMASMDGSRSKLDHALAATLALTRVAASRGDRVTIIAFTDKIERLIRVRSGINGAALAYRALFDIEARLTEPAYDAATEAVSQIESRRATVILLTSVVDLAAAELLQESVMRLKRHHRAVLVNLEDPDLTTLALGPATTAQQGFAKVSSLEILLNNRRLAGRLRHTGIQVLNTASDRLAWDTLQAYLTMSRGRAATSMVPGTTSSGKAR